MTSSISSASSHAAAAVSITTATTAATTNPRHHTDDNDNDDTTHRHLFHQLDALIQYFWHYKVMVKEGQRGRDADESRLQQQRQQQQQQQENSSGNASPHLKTTSIDYKLLEMDIFRTSSGTESTTAPPDSSSTTTTTSHNFIQVYYIGKVIDWIRRETLMHYDIYHQEQREMVERGDEEGQNEGEKQGALSGSSGSSSASTTISPEALQSIWKKYDSKRHEYYQTNTLKHRMQLFVVIRKYLLGQLIDCEEELPRKVAWMEGDSANTGTDGVASPSQTRKDTSLSEPPPQHHHDADASIAPEQDFEFVARQNEMLQQQLLVYNQKAARICLKFIDVLHKHVMNLRYTGPVSLRLFLQSVVIPLLSRASRWNGNNDHGESQNFSFNRIPLAEQKLTYSLCNYILDLIPRFQQHVLQFVTESIIPILPDAVSYCVLELLFTDIFHKTPYHTLKEYIARTIRVHRHLYMQKHLFMDLLAHIKALDIDLLRRRKHEKQLTTTPRLDELFSLTNHPGAQNISHKESSFESYFDANSLIYSRNLLSQQEVGARSKRNFLFLYNILKCGKQEFEKQLRIPILTDAIKLASLCLENPHQKSIPSPYRDFLKESMAAQQEGTQFSYSSLLLTSAEAEFLIQEFILHNYRLYLQETYLQTGLRQHKAALKKRKELFLLLAHTVSCYEELSIRLDSADALIYYHRQFLLRILESFCLRDDEQPITQPEIKLLTRIVCKGLCGSTAMRFFLALSKKPSFREEFLKPVQAFLLLLLEMMLHSPLGDEGIQSFRVLSQCFQDCLVRILYCLNQCLLHNQSSLVNGRNGKLNDILSMFIELCCASDDFSALHNNDIRHIANLCRQSLIFLVREMQQGSSNKQYKLKVREENWVMLKKLIGGKVSLDSLVVMENVDQLPPGRHDADVGDEEEEKKESATGDV